MRKVNVNIDALKALRTYLFENFSNISPKLIMDSFAYGFSDVRKWHEVAEHESIHSCNTAACLAGWGATSNHPLLKPVPSDESWVDYINRVYGLRVGEYVDVIGELDESETPSEFDREYDIDSPVYGFIFIDFWPNDLAQGIARIDYVIEHNAIPDEWDFLKSTY